MSDALVRAGAAVGEPIEFEVINLPASVVDRFGVDAKAALVHPSSGLARGTLIETEIGGLVLCAEPRDDIERGCLALAEVAQLNCRLTSHQRTALRRFDASSIPLRAAECDVRLRFVRTGAPSVAIDAQKLAQLLQRRHFERVLTVGELIVVVDKDIVPAPHELVVRLLSVELDDSEDQRDHDELLDGDALHVFRGRVTGRSTFYLRLTEQFGGVELINALTKPLRAPKSSVRLLSNDGEEFVIAKATLRPCIALTAVVRDTSSELLDAHVDIDACTLDRAILFLQMFARRCHDEFEVPLNCVADLLVAAEKLQFSLLEDFCRKLQGDARNRVQMRRWADVKQSIAEKKMWLLIDGGVFDVTAWLPRHPGGAKIIPAQALGVD